MKKYLIVPGVLLIHILSTGSLYAAPLLRQHLLMDYNWRFIQSDVIHAEQLHFDDSQWRTLNLPHDWSIEGEFKKDAATTGYGGYLPAGIGWYRKHFTIAKIQ